MAIPRRRAASLMRARKVRTQSELINTLLAEEEERLRSHAVAARYRSNVRARSAPGDKRVVT